jgi:Cu/Ag efflux pump CusA
LRYQENHRNNAEAISNLLAPTLRGAQVPVKNIVTIERLTGPSVIFRDDNRRYSYQVAGSRPRHGQHHIALFGIGIQNGVILIPVFKSNLQKIGRLITATVLTLPVFPLFFYAGYRKIGQKMNQEIMNIECRY